MNLPHFWGPMTKRRKCQEPEQQRQRRSQRIVRPCPCLSSFSSRAFSGDEVPPPTVLLYRPGTVPNEIWTVRKRVLCVPLCQYPTFLVGTPFEAGARDSHTHLLVVDELPNPVTCEHQELVFRRQYVLGNLGEGDDPNLSKQQTEPTDLSACWYNYLATTIL